LFDRVYHHIHGWLACWFWAVLCALQCKLVSSSVFELLRGLPCAADAFLKLFTLVDPKKPDAVRTLTLTCPTWHMRLRHSQLDQLEPGSASFAKERDLFAMRSLAAEVVSGTPGKLAQGLVGA
jgi:hypothetical protein